MGERSELAVTSVSVAVQVDAPPEEVWKMVSDPRNLPDWDRHIVSVEGIGPDGLHPGAEYVTVMKFMGVSARISSRVLEWIPPTYSVIRLRGVLNATVTTTVHALPHDRSLLHHAVEYRFRGGALGAIAARSLAVVGGAQYALRRGAMAQKRTIESSRKR